MDQPAKFTLVDLVDITAPEVCWSLPGDPVTAHQLIKDLQVSPASPFFVAMENLHYNIREWGAPISLLPKAHYSC